MAKFRRVRNSAFSYSSPQEMYADNKTGSVDGLYDRQSSIIDKYMDEAYQEKDVAIELPTGGGKTLIGLLIGEFRRRKNSEKVVYCCINNLLANQTYQHAIQYGLNAKLFVGPKSDYQPLSIDAYRSAEYMAITSYSALFNSNPFFNDADIILFDDAHSAEELISSNWTVQIDEEDSSTHDLYYQLIEILKPWLPRETYNKIVMGYRSSSMRDWVDIVPGTKSSEYLPSIQKCINRFLETSPASSIRYAWKLIYNNLDACNIYVADSSICIRPYIPPTFTFTPFSSAKQHIYMSATPGCSGELERSFGVSKIAHINTEDGWSSRTMGRRLFLFPFASFDSKDKDEALIKLINKTERSLILVDSRKSERKYSNLVKEKTNKNIYHASDFEREKTSFVKDKNAIAILANRMDGIDFPDSECRMEIVLGLSKETHIQEQFFVNTVGARPLYSERLRSRLVQAFGRCTRSQNDYSVVCVLSEKANYLSVSPSETKKLNPELQAELKFGHENAIDQDSLDDYFCLIDIFLNDRQDWAVFEEDIIGIRDDIVAQRQRENASSGGGMGASHDLLDQACFYEVKATSAIWNKDFSAALEEIKKILNILNNDELVGYYAYWCYIASCCLSSLFVQTGKSEYQKEGSLYLEQAKRKTEFSAWFSEAMNDNYESAPSERSSVVLGIERKISQEVGRTTSRKTLIEKLDVLLDTLRNASGEDFEEAHRSFGEWLGFLSVNPKGDAEPDPIWIVDNTLFIVSEDKIYDNYDKEIPVKHVRQAAGHEKWVRSKSEDFQILPDATGVTVFLTTASNLANNADIHAEGIFYLKRDVFAEWAERAISVLKEAVLSFDSEGNAHWRNRLSMRLCSSEVTSNDYLKLIKKTKLSSLPVPYRDKHNK